MGGIFFPSELRSSHKHTLARRPDKYVSIERPYPHKKSHLIGHLKPPYGRHIMYQHNVWGACGNRRQLTLTIISIIPEDCREWKKRWFQKLHAGGIKSANALIESQKLQRAYWTSKDPKQTVTIQGQKSAVDSPFPSLSSSIGRLFSVHKLI